MESYPTREGAVNIGCYCSLKRSLMEQAAQQRRSYLQVVNVKLSDPSTVKSIGQAELPNLRKVALASAKRSRKSVSAFVFRSDERLS